VFVLVSILFFSFVSAQSTGCIPKTCTDGVCIVGKCYDFNELGQCISLSEKYSDTKSTCERINFGAQVEGGTEFRKETCGKVGCVWNEENPLTCEGTIKSCSGLKEECLTGLGYELGCEWENSGIYSKKLYWRGDGIITNGGHLAVSVSENVIRNIEHVGIPVFMVLEYSELPKDTEVTFEIYKSPDGAGIEIRGEEVRFPGSIGIRVGNDALVGFIDENGNAVVPWTITEEDLAIAEYDGYDHFFFVVKKDGKIFYSFTNSINQELGTVMSVQVEKYDLLLITKKGECNGIISCETFSKKWECEDTAEVGGSCGWIGATSSCEGQGVSCNVIGDGEICENYGCSWRADSIWERFKSWLGILFRILPGA